MVIEEGQIIKQAVTSKGADVLLRYPMMDDVPAMLDFINTLSNERTFLYVQGKQFTLEEETSYIQQSIGAVQAGNRVHVAAFVGGELVGSTEITRDGADANHHRGHLGIAVAAHYRDKGIGHLLMRTALEEAERHLLGLQMVLLSVFGNNPGAIHLYEKVGFTEYGRLPKGFRHRDEFVDEVYMVREF